MFQSSPTGAKANQKASATRTMAIKMMTVEGRGYKVSMLVVCHRRRSVCVSIHRSIHFHFLSFIMDIAKLFTFAHSYAVDSFLSFFQSFEDLDVVFETSRHSDWANRRTAAS